jgi:uncharacterized cupredoxin-like copper-binding protein
MTRPLLAVVLAAAAVLALGALAIAGPSDARSARVVSVLLDDGVLDADRGAVRAGSVTLLARNTGAQEHELALLRTDLPADRLPVGLSGVRYAGAGRLVVGTAHGHAHVADRGHPGHIAPGGRDRVRVDLTPGRYVLLCNLPGHYAAGQRAALTVTP